MIPVTVLLLNKAISIVILTACLYSCPRTLLRLYYEDVVPIIKLSLFFRQYTAQSVPRGKILKIPRERVASIPGRTEEWPGIDCLRMRYTYYPETG